MLPVYVHEFLHVGALPSSWWCGQWSRCVWWVCPGSSPPPWSPSWRPSPGSWRSPSFPSHRCSWKLPRQIYGYPRPAPSLLTLWCPHMGSRSHGRLWLPQRIGGPWGKRVSATFPGSCSWGHSRCRCPCPGIGFHWHPVSTNECKLEKAEAQQKPSGRHQFKDSIDLHCSRHSQFLTWAN